MRRFSALLLATPTLLGAQQVASTRVASLSGESMAPRATANAAVAMKTDRAPIIDGRADDAIWSRAQVIDGYRMYDPVENGEPRFRTEARIAYDERTLYVLVRAFDPHPDSIVGLLARRDNRTASDEVKVIVDGYRDKRSGFEFAINPAGVKRDIYTFNDGDEDTSWDGVWDAAARIDSLGWVAEFRIPLSQIRFKKGEQHTFGLMLIRDIQRYNEHLSWPVYNRGKGGLSSQFGELTGIQGIATPHRLEVAPYSVAKTYNAEVGAGPTFGQKSVATVGADIKYGITSNLTLDATVNPDFGQVESDPSILNLGTVETFLPEKRPFFLEGQGIFRFDMNCNDGTCSGLFYSRRIGRAPQLSGEYYDPSNPLASTILGAGKLTGRVGNGISVGLLDASTQREVAPGGRTIEPQTNYFVGRVQKEFREGASSVGFMGTAVNRSLDEFTDAFLRRAAYVGGVDARHQFWNRNYEVSGYYAQSEMQGSQDAIAALQRSPVHNYLRPDDDLIYDPTRTSLAGNSFQVMLNKRGGGITRGTFGYQRHSGGFESNDVGFLGRANSQNQFLWLNAQLRNPKWIYRFWGGNINEWQNWTADGLRLDFGGNINTHMQLKNNWWLHFGQGVNSLAGSYCESCSRGGPAVRVSRSWNGWAGVEGDGRKSITPYLFWMWGWGDDRQSYWFGVDPQVEFRVSSRFNGSVGLDWNHSVNATQYKSDDAPVDNATHYTFAKLDQHTLSGTVRMNFTATPNLSLQVYAQPYVSGGDYGPWMELADVHAQRFADRYQPYRGGADPGALLFKQLRSNTVVRWEYRPGSVLYFVWTQERGNYDEALNTPQFDARDDYRNLFKLHPGNVFLIKGSYWLSF